MLKRDPVAQAAYSPLGKLGTVRPGSALHHQRHHQYTAELTVPKPCEALKTHSRPLQ